MVSTVMSPPVKHIPLAGSESVFMAVDINGQTFASRDDPTSDTRCRDTRAVRMRVNSVNEDRTPRLATDVYSFKKHNENPVSTANARQ